MAEKPILFNTEMVRAILDGRKTQTRRVVKQLIGIDKDDFCRNHQQNHEFVWDDFGGIFKRTGFVCRICGLGVSPPHSRYGVGNSWIRPPYNPGNVLWVKETWKNATGDPAGGGYALFDTYIYKADGKAKVDYPIDEMMVEDRWRPSIFMPKRAARIFLRVTGVRIERLQAIQTMDAVAEGADARWYQDEWGNPIYENTPIDVFSELWDSTIKKADLPLYGWGANPWVWVISFERMDRMK